MKWQAIIMGLSALGIYSNVSAQWFGNNGWMPFSSSYGGNWVPFSSSYGNGFRPFSQSGWGMNPRWRGRGNRSPFSWWGNQAWTPYTINIYDSYGAMTRYAPYYPQNAQAMLPITPVYGAAMPLQSPLLPPFVPAAAPETTPVMAMPNAEAKAFSPFESP